PSKGSQGSSRRQPIASLLDLLAQRTVEVVACRVVLGDERRDVRMVGREYQAVVGDALGERLEGWVGSRVGSQFEIVHFNGQPCGAAARQLRLARGEDVAEQLIELVLADREPL